MKWRKVGRHCATDVLKFSKRNITVVNSAFTCGPVPSIGPL